MDIVEFIKYNSFVCLIREHTRRFVRSCKWFVFMYNNHNWDSQYLYEMIDKKLSDMEYLHTNHSHCTTHYSIARLIKLTRKYYYISKNFEFTNAWKKFEERYGKWSMITTKVEKGDKWLKTQYPKCNSEKENVHAIDISSRLFRMEEYIREKYRIKFLTMIIKYGEWWWD